MCSREDLDSKATAQSLEKRMTSESSIARLAKLEKRVEEIWEATNKKLETLLARSTDKACDVM